MSQSLLSARGSLQPPQKHAAELRQLIAAGLQDPAPRVAQAAARCYLVHQSASDARLTQLLRGKPRSFAQRYHQLPITQLSPGARVELEPMQLGVMFGSPETTTGGCALKFYASVRLDIRRIGTLKDGDQVIDLGAAAGLIEKSGSWYSCNGTRIGQGRDAAMQYLLEHGEMLQEVRRKLLEKHGIGKPAAATAESTEKKPGARRATAAAA